jgi:asparagine synthase (glutamine-hydrolysing)
LSGIVGIFHRGGAPVERTCLQGFTDFLAFRGPDYREIWSEGPIGLGHAMLRTTHESADERQPASLDGRFSITANARLDSREELVAKLESAGRQVRPSLPDSMLILLAYAVWGGECVDHLRGDFAFAIWDAQTRTLFCARDHFGIKPFYYAELGELFLFSNTLNCVRLHPDVSDELNEAAIADFLLFGLNYNNATTSFRDIRRLPPAHSLAVSPDGIKMKRYWTPPTDGRIRYRRAAEYVDHFQSLLQAAVKDRLRTDRVGILLSGGLDSPSLAATAKELSTTAGGVPELYSYTAVYESLIPDNDGPFAREVAECLGIPNRRLAMDHVRPFERWDDPNLSWPEPVDDPLFAGLFEQFGMIAKDCRVVLYGEGSDNLMYFQMWPYVADLRRNAEWKRLLTEVPQYLWRRPFPWRGIRSRLQGFFGQDPIAPAFPPWIAPDFARRMNLEARWKECIALPLPSVRHPIHPKAHASMFIPQWTRMFELQDAGVTRFPVEVRYPFLDIRLVNFLLGLPPFPYFFQKKLLRDAMVGHLPERIRVRAKTPLPSDQLLEKATRWGSECVNQVRWNEKIEQFINRSSLGKLHGNLNAEQVSSGVRPYCLNFWLRSARRIR